MRIKKIVMAKKIEGLKCRESFDPASPDRPLRSK